MLLSEGGSIPEFQTFAAIHTSVQGGLRNTTDLDLNL